MSGIRVTYSGLLGFIISLTSVITGLVFTIIVTRQLTQEEFGTWGIIGVMTGYVLILDPIVSYWTTREIARGEKSGKTAVMSSSMFSSIAVFSYIIIVSVFQTQIEIPLELMLFAAILIPLAYLRTVLTAIGLGFKPESKAYGIFVFELTKIPIGLVLIYFLDFGLVGAIATIVIASIFAIIIIAIQIRTKLKDRFEKKYLKSWLKRFWIPTYPKISNRITNLDVIAFTLFAGSIADLAYWTAANAVSKMIAHSGQISTPIYGKLLGGGKIGYLEDNVIHIFYFIFPLVAMTIIFAKPALFILNPIYEIASSIVIVMSFVIFLQTLNQVWTNALTGTENVDLNKNATPRDYIKSRLIAIPTLRTIQRSVYLISLIVMFLTLSSGIENKIELIFYWALIALITQIPLNSILYILVRRNLKPKIKVLPIIKYLCSTIFVFGITYYFMEKFLEYPISIFNFLPEFIIFVLLGTCGYLGLTYLTDIRTRKLFKSIINEILKK